MPMRFEYTLIKKLTYINKKGKKSFRQGIGTFAKELIKVLRKHKCLCWVDDERLVIEVPNEYLEYK